MRAQLSFEGVGQWPGEFAHVIEAVKMLAPKTIVEIGVCEGKWIWLLAPYLPQGAAYYGVDPTPVGAIQDFKAKLAGGAGG